MLSPKCLNLVASTYSLGRAEAKALFMWLVKYLTLFLLVVFILPALATIVWWELQDRPASWRTADWSASGVLAKAGSDA